MRDGEHLPLVRDGPHFLADGVRDFSADVCVDLVKNEQRNRVLCGERGLYGEHHAGDFAAAGDSLERLCRLSGIWREDEVDGLVSV